MIEQAQPFLSPEAIGMGGLGIGGVGVLAFLKFVFDAGGTKKVLQDLVNELRETMKSIREHHTTEEKHQTAERGHHKVVEGLLTEIKTHQTVGIPRPVTGEHTPIRGIETTPTL